MRLVSCSVCFAVVPAKQTAIVEHKRVCKDCRKK